MKNMRKNSMSILHVDLLSSTWVVALIICLRESSFVKAFLEALSSLGASGRQATKLYRSNFAKIPAVGHAPEIIAHVGT